MFVITPLAGAATSKAQPLRARVTGGLVLTESRGRKTQGSHCSQWAALPPPAYFALWALLLQLPGNASDGASRARSNHHHVDLACRPEKRDVRVSTASSTVSLLSKPHVPQLLQQAAGPSSAQGAEDDLQISQWFPRFLHAWHLLAEGGGRISAPPGLSDHTVLRQSVQMNNGT